MGKTVLCFHGNKILFSMTWQQFVDLM